MLNPTPETYREELAFLSGRLDRLRQELQERGIDRRAALDGIQREKDSLSAKLCDAQRKDANWNFIKADFGGAWNKFVMDLEVLEEEVT